MRLFLALCVIVAALWVLESARWGVSVTRFDVGETPVTAMARPDADGPAVVVAHGFAGSSQMMQGYGFALAHSGYRVFAFDFLGHGRNPVPMSGDVTAVEGTTRLLIDQTVRVIESVSDDDRPVALLGHSMATDVLVRIADERQNTGPLVLLSAFSNVVDADTPQSLLLVVGGWEPGLREFALDAVRMVDAGAEAGQTVTSGGVTRRAVVAPYIEHVSILKSRAGISEAVDWLDQNYGRTSDVSLPPIGPALVGLLVGLVVLLGGLMRRLPSTPVPALDLSRGRFALICLGPAIVTPPLALALDPGLMPVLVADYLAIHLALYGAIQLGLLTLWRCPLGPLSVVGFLAVVAGCAVFGLALDRYAANFWPTESRAWIIAVMSLGAILFFVADARLAHLASLGRRFLVHAAFLASLFFAVALDFEGLFFLLMIAPVIVLFYLIFGTIGHKASTRAGPLSAGVALGLMLAWSLGVSFPLFSG